MNQLSEKSSPFSDALTSMASSMRARAAKVRPVSQIIFQLNGPSAESDFANTRSIVLRWLSSRTGKPLPESAKAGGSFELDEVGAQRASAVFLKEQNYWAIRFDDADKNTAQRTWITEIGLAIHDNKVIFGCRLTCVTLGEDAAFVPSLPRFIRQIVREIGADLDGTPIGQDPWVVSTNKDVDVLVALLRNRSRRRNVFVFSLPENSEEKADAALPIGQIRSLLEKTYGAAHIAILTGPAAFILSNQVGKEFSVFNKAVRTYRPGFDDEEDQPHDHPLALYQTVEDWPGGGKAAFEDFLIAQALKISGSRQDIENELPPFRVVRRIETELRSKAARESDGSLDGLLELAEEEIGELKADLSEQRGENESLLDIAEQERNEAVKKADELQDQSVAMRFRLEMLESRLESQDTAQTDIEIPASLNDLEAWAKDHLAGSVVLHNRAKRAAKHSPLEDASIVYKALLLLKNHYVSMRRDGGGEKQKRYIDECQKLNLSDEQCFPGSRANEQGEEYFITYAGKRCELDRHLKGSNSRDRKKGFRLYYFWDDDSRQVIVGSLPSHLKTRAS